MDALVRGLTERDWPDALVLAEKVFEVGPWLFHSLNQGSSDRRFSDASGAFVDGELVSLVDCFFRHVRMPNGESAKMAGIGTVCTLPEFRNQGLSGLLLQRTDQVMKQEGADFSMLFTGVQGHYARFGWVEVPRYWKERQDIPYFEEESEGFTLEERKWWKPLEPLMLDEIYAEAAEGVPITCERDESVWLASARERMNRPERNSFLAWEGEYLAGWMAVGHGKDNLEIIEACGSPETLAPLASAACKWGIEKGLTKLSLNLPNKLIDRLPGWLTSGTTEASGNWTMVKAISKRWSQAEYEELFTSKQAHHFALDDF